MLHLSRLDGSFTITPVVVVGSLGKAISSRSPKSSATVFFGPNRTASGSNRFRFAFYRDGASLIRRPSAADMAPAPPSPITVPCSALPLGSCFARRGGTTSDGARAHRRHAPPAVGAALAWLWRWLVLERL